MPFTSAPVDPARFSGIMFMGCEPKLDRDTGNQHTDKAGTSRKWTVRVAATKPTTWDASQTEADVLQVTVTSPEDPGSNVPMGTPVTFTDFAVGVMAPESGDNGKIRGGRLFWSATGVRPVNSRAKAE